MILNPLLLLSILLSLWCFFHSFLITNSSTKTIQNKTGNLFRYYRIFYNLFSLLTFLPIIYYSFSIKSETVFKWEGKLQIVRGLLFILTFYLFYAGSKAYDLLSFIGLRQMKEPQHHKSLSQHGSISTNGILSFIRHPWYTATFLTIWLQNLNKSTIIVNLILSIYLLIGCYLEEKKLVLDFGSEYQEYQKKVSMLFPLKWIKNKLRK
ncbi:isoprenylcysteine carboxylmethyltransferase family protein [Labilibaculum sp.]|uniref:methyltransferase family protein n=1 Tax=Labilibaculum sp. TaxID=2060723 RepID=UPI00356A93D6